MEIATKALVFSGIVLILLGVFWQFGLKDLPLGRLPGDLRYENKTFRFYFPLGTSLAISILLTLIFWIYFWFTK